MKLIWKITAAAVIGWTGSVACEKAQESEWLSQRYQDIFFARTPKLSPLEAQIKERKQQAVDRRIKEKARIVVDYLAEYRDTTSSCTYGLYTKHTQHGTLLIKRYGVPDTSTWDKLTVQWLAPKQALRPILNAEAQIVYETLESKHKQLDCGISVYRPGDWEKVLDELQPEAREAKKVTLAKERVEQQSKVERTLSLKKRKWGLDE